MNFRSSNKIYKQYSAFALVVHCCHWFTLFPDVKLDDDGDCCCCCCSPSGRLNSNTAPPLLSGLFSAHILPPCASTMLLQINNPKPVPVSDAVANFVNNLGTISSME